MKADGNASGIVQLFLMHRSRLEASVLRLVGCRVTAGDLVQDLFLRLWGRVIEREDEAVGYMFRSARNLAIDHLRAEKARRGLISAAVPEQWASEPSSPERTLAARDQVGAVAEALQALPERARHAFLLNRLHGKSYEQIARALGVSVSTVEKDMMRALAACRAVLPRDEQGG